MTCLKCGRETDQTFCVECRAVMDRYPVKPNAIILLPKRRPRVNRKANARRQVISLEEKVEQQRLLIRRLLIALLAMVVLFVSLGTAFSHFVKEKQERPMGQNYSTVTKATNEPNAETD